MHKYDIIGSLSINMQDEMRNYMTMFLMQLVVENMNNGNRTQRWVKNNEQCALI